MIGQMPYIQVIAGREFSPADIAGLVGWWKADGTLWQDSARTTPAVSDADPVGAWDDASGSGNHAIQATASKRPTLKLVIQNGLPVLRFDGTDDSLRAVFTLNQPYTRFAVLRKRSGHSAAHILIDGGTDATGYLYFAFNDTPRMYAGAALDGGSHTDDAWHIWRATFDTWDSKMQLDGASVTTGYPGGSHAGGIVLGSGNAGNQWYADVDIAEVLDYDTALSDDDVASVLEYLNDRWGIY